MQTFHKLVSFVVQASISLRLEVCERVSTSLFFALFLSLSRSGLLLSVVHIVTVTLYVYA